MLKPYVTKVKREKVIYADLRSFKSLDRRFRVG